MWDRRIDVTDPAILQGRTWLWLQRHIEALLTAPPAVVVDRWGRVHEVPATRIGLRLAPPDFTPPTNARAPILEE